MTTAKDFLDYELVDDSTPYGGKSFSDETLKDFLDEVELPYSTPMNLVNKHLKGCGIEPIPYKEYTEKYYQPTLYSDDGTNIDYNLPEELHSFEVFHSREECADWLEDNGYNPQDCIIEEYYDDDIEEHVYVDDVCPIDYNGDDVDYNA